jgi:hypothetical protein
MVDSKNGARNVQEEPAIFGHHKISVLRTTQKGHRW